MSLPVITPFKESDTIRVPKGTYVRELLFRQRQTLVRVMENSVVGTVQYSWNGYVITDNVNAITGEVYLPTVAVAFRDGHERYVDVQVTPELCEVNSIRVPELPGKDGYFEGVKLDVTLSYDGLTYLWSTGVFNWLRSPD